MEKKPAVAGSLDLISLTQKDLMQLLGVGKTTLNKMLRAGVLPVVEVAKGRYVTTQAKIDDWLQKFIRYGGKLNY